MTWWGCLLIGYGVSFMSGVAVYEEGPEPGFWSEWLFFGTILSGAALIGWWFA